MAGGGVSRGPPSLLPTALQDKHPSAEDGDGDDAHSSSGLTDPSSACHTPLARCHPNPPKVAVLGERIGGSSTAGSSPARGLAQHHATLGSHGVGREAVAGPGLGDALPKEILDPIFHPNPS